MAQACDNHSRPFPGCPVDRQKLLCLAEIISILKDLRFQVYMAYIN